MSEVHRFRLARAIELDIDPFHYRGEISPDLRVPEADEAIAFVLEPALAFEIACGRGVFVVVPAVEFDDEALGRQKKSTT